MEVLMARMVQCAKFAMLLASIFGFIALARAAFFDYVHYDALLKHYVKPGVSIDGITVTAVDYTGLAVESKKLDSPYSTLIRQLATFNPDTLDSVEDKKAFWINVYNIGAIKTIVDYYPVDSIRSRKINWLGLPWDRKVITVGGKEYSLGEIENDILLDTFKDLRIHFGINCASVSCVDLTPSPYRGSTFSKQLEEQGKKFLSDQKKGLRIDRDKKTIYLSQVFKFDKKRFDSLGGGPLAFVLPFLSFGDQEFVKKEKVAVEYLEHNLKSNDLIMLNSFSRGEKL